MERTIGNLGEEIRLHSDPYANLTQRIIERSRVNAVKNMAPDLAMTNSVAAVRFRLDLWPKLRTPNWTIGPV